MIGRLVGIEFFTQNPVEPSGNFFAGVFGWEVPPADPGAPLRVRTDRPDPFSLMMYPKLTGPFTDFVGRLLGSQPPQGMLIIQVPDLVAAAEAVKLHGGMLTIEAYTHPQWGSCQPVADPQGIVHVLLVTTSEPKKSG